MIAGQAPALNLAGWTVEEMLIRRSVAMKDLLAAKHIPVILGRPQELPQDEDAPYDQSYLTASQLVPAGIKIAFATFSASLARRLPYQAANCVP